MKIKRMIKRITPDHVIRVYRELKMLPEYFDAVRKDFMKKKPILSFISDEETVRLIVEERKSLCRFGDGEIRWMLGYRLDSFQEYSDRLSEGLERAFLSNNTDLLVGIPLGIVDSRKCNFGSKLHWRAIRLNFAEAFEKLGMENRRYANASITRPYIDYNDRKYSEQCFKNLKKIWDKKDVVFVEGRKTKLGMGNDLFSNAKSISRILCPTVNAFEKIDDIKSSIRKNCSENNIILLALGPTATVLAAEMCDEGFQMIDIGHVDVEYIWYLRHDLLRKPIDGKYVNESGERIQSDLYEKDKEYLDSIIDEIE